MGRFRGIPVWAPSGLSPCIPTDNRILFGFNGNIAELDLHGACALQGIDPASLPADPTAARAAVGSSIDKEAYAFVLYHYLLYLKRAHALPHLLSPATTLSAKIYFVFLLRAPPLRSQFPRFRMATPLQPHYPASTSIHLTTMVIQ